MVRVIPDVLSQNAEEVSEKVEKVKGFAELFHVDIIDGVFADNFTVSPADLRAVDFGKIKLDLHLMVDDPMAWVEESVSLSPSRLISQIERMGSQKTYVDWVEGYDVKAGLAVDLFTPISSLERDVLGDVSVVLLMSVKAGASGQVFDESVVDKIKELRGFYTGDIVVDGGINPKTAWIVEKAGASEVAVNSYLWQGDDIQKLLEEFDGAGK